MIPSTITWRNHTWYLHSYVFGKALANSTAASIRKSKFKVARVVKIHPEVGERLGRFAVYWRISK